MGALQCAGEAYQPPEETAADRMYAEMGDPLNISNNDSPTENIEVSRTLDTVWTTERSTAWASQKAANLRTRMVRHNIPGNVQVLSSEDEVYPVGRIAISVDLESGTEIFFEISYQRA